MKSTRGDLLIKTSKMLTLDLKDRASRQDWQFADTLNAKDFEGHLLDRGENGKRVYSPLPLRQKNFQNLPNSLKFSEIEVPTELQSLNIIDADR